MNETPLRILLTNSTAIYGGGEFFVFELARGLRSLRGHNVWVACRPDNQLRTMCEQASIPVLPLEFPTDGKHLVHITGALNRMIREDGINILHSNSNYDRTAGAFAAWRAGIPHVTNVHSLQSIQYNLTHRLRNRFLIDRFLADGVQAKNILVQTDHVSEKKITVFYHGVNAREMKKDEGLRTAIRKEFRIAGDQVLIGNVARFVPMKGHDDLLQAFAQIAPAAPQARLMLVGDGELLELMKRRAAELCVDSRVIFTGYRADLQALYSAFDLYVHSSLHGEGETISFATQQALAQELPVVVTRAGDVPENVREGVNGFVVDDHNPGALASKMLFLLSNPVLRERMGAESRKYLLERFTTERMVDAVDTVYHEVLSSRKRS